MEGDQMWLVVVWRVVDRNNNKIMATIAWTCGGRSDPLMSLPCGAHHPHLVCLGLIGGG